ncbi:MAG: acyl-CoA dehydrogenase family protein, partial [Solirubrobacteraceae bacterium]
MSTEKSVAQRSMGLGLRALGALAGSPALDKLGMRKQTEKLIYGATKNGFRAATAASRTFKIAQSLPGPARQGSSKAPSLFDITPDDEQQMLQEAVRDFAAEKVRPAAAQADADTGTPKELLEQTSELGVNMLGIPEELGGVMAQRAAVTGVLIAEALAHGDMGVAYALLAPGAVASTIGLFGDADQQAAYLPAFAGEAPPAAALALLESQPLFNPLRLSTKARRDGGDW